MKASAIKLKKTSIFAETISRTWSNVGARIGIIIFALIVILCVFAPVFAPYGVNDMDLKAMYQDQVSHIPLVLTEWAETN